MLKRLLVMCMIFALIITYIVTVNVAAADYTHGIEVSGTTATIWFRGTAAISWVDVHYNINSGAQQNVRMTYNSTAARYEHKFTVAAGNTINYSFTYSTSTGAYDTAWFVYKVVSTTPTPIRTPTPSCTCIKTPTPTPSILGKVIITNLAYGNVKFSITLPEQKSNVLLFARKNNIQDYTPGDLTGTGVNNGNGTYTYSITRSGAYVNGDVITVRFYTYSPTGGQVYYPGPTETTWSAPFTYYLIVPTTTPTPIPTPAIGKVTIIEDPYASIRYSIRLDKQATSVYLFGARNGLMDYTPSDLKPSEVNNGDGTYTYSITRPMPGYTPGNVITAKFTVVYPTGTVYYPGPTDSTWSSPGVVYRGVVP